MLDIDISAEKFQQMATKALESTTNLAVSLGGKMLGALALWIVGRMLIGMVRRLVRQAGERNRLDSTLVRYIDSVLGVGLQILLIVAILGVFGVETTTFAGVLAAVGVAIGMAWSGLLSNFAAGVFLIVLAPFRVGDRITVAGTTGTVHELSLFVTAINTDDGIRVYIGNSKIFSDTIVNYRTNPYRRVDMPAQLAHGVNPVEAIGRLKKRLAEIPHVAKDPGPQVEIDKFNLAGTVLLVRTYTNDATFWDVYFAMTQVIADEFGKALYPPPAEYRIQSQLASRPQ